MSDETYYLMGGGDSSSDGKAIKCPKCEVGSTPDFPTYTCPNCGTEITFVVAEVGSIPSDLANWAAAQEEFQELRYQVAGQEEFIQEHEERLDKLESREDVLADLGDIQDRLDRLDAVAEDLEQFENVVRSQLSEVPSDG